MKYKATRILLVLAIVAALVTVARAPQAAQITQPASEDRVALYQALLDLSDPWTVMCVAAHPDDEDGTSLIVMRHKYGAHTVSLFSTFGEGGQNAIGPELYEELGAIRARETMAAAEIQGSEPHFLGLKDFGFSKTRAEAFKFWGHEEALRRMVLEIRKQRPDVIITNHSTTSNDHGQHQATALMVVEAFDAAADPNKCPEQLRDGLTTWQVQRLFVRARGNQQQAANTQIVTIDPNEKDPVRGVVYAEEALRGLQQHATQGPWPKSFAEYANRFRAFSGQTSAPTGQLPMIRYSLVKSANGAAAVPAQESHNFLDGLQLPAEARTESAVPALSGSLLELSANPEQTFAQLVEGFRHSSYGHAVARPFDPQRRERMKGRVEQALALADGIHYQIRQTTAFTTPGARLVLSGKLDNKSSGELSEQCNSWFDSSSPHPLQPEGSLQVPASAPVNLPLSHHLYDGRWRGLTVKTRCTFRTPSVTFNLERTTYVDVAPTIEIQRITPSPLVLTPRSIGAPVSLTVGVANNNDLPFDGRIVAQGVNVPIHLDAHSIKNVEVRISPILSPTTSDLDFRILGSANQSAALPVFFSKAEVAPLVKVGYIRGFDFSLPNALNALGVESKELSVDDVKATDLSKFTSVIVDNRVYESKPELIAVNQKLLDYANAGGTLIIFYHKSDEWNPDERRNRPQLAPYKLILGGERVTDENAPITFIEPDHPLLNSPNKMGQDDFNGWIQERGLYYPREWDPQFHALLQSNDPGEQPLKGGLLVADYGKGHYIYTSMVWYRELRGGIPGAYRMLANMISYGR